MDAILEPLLRSPRLPRYVELLTQQILAEQARREEFYETMSESQKTEFINGEVIVHSPVKLRHHNAAFALVRLIGAYNDVHGLGVVGYEKILIVLTRNAYEPDICFFGNAKSETFTPDQMKFPAPDFVVEVLSPSTERIDRETKFEDYAAHDVDEYWIIDPESSVVEQYLLHDGVYNLQMKSSSGWLVSRAIKGFRIPVEAIFDERSGLETLREILRA